MQRLCERAPVENPAWLLAVWGLRHHRKGKLRTIRTPKYIHIEGTSSYSTCVCAFSQRKFAELILRFEQKITLLGFIHGHSVGIYGSGITLWLVRGRVPNHGRLLHCQWTFEENPKICLEENNKICIFLRPRVSSAFSIKNVFGSWHESNRTRALALVVWNVEHAPDILRFYCNRHHPRLCHDVRFTQFWWVKTHVLMSILPPTILLLTMGSLRTAHEISWVRSR